MHFSVRKCYVIKEWFFYINHFSLIIFYHLVWWGFEPFGCQSRCIVNWCSLCSREKDMTIPICHNKPQTGNESGVWMTSCPEEMVLRIWGFWKESVGFWPLKDVVGFWPLKEELGFRPLRHAVEFFGSLPTVILNITRCTAQWGGVSIVWLALALKNCVSLLMLPWTKARN